MTPKETRQLGQYAGRDAAKRALLPLFTLPAEKLTEAFNKLADERQWSRPTRIARLNKALTLPHLVANAKAANQQVAALKELRRSLEAIQPPAWDPQAEGEYMTTADAEHLAQLMEEQPENKRLLAPVLLAYLLTQRVGDVLAWRTDNVRLIERADPATNTVSILVVEGKTVARTGPYAVQCWQNSIAAKLLMELKSEDTTTPYLFLKESSILEDHAEVRKAVIQQQRKIKQVWKQKLLAPRRGSAVALGSLATPEEDIMTLSRHPQPHTLRRYMAAGLMSNSEGFKQAKTNGKLEALLQGTALQEPSKATRSAVSDRATSPSHFTSRRLGE